MAHLYLPVIPTTLACMADTKVLEVARKRFALIHAPPDHSPSVSIPSVVLPKMPGAPLAELMVSAKRFVTACAGVLASATRTAMLKVPAAVGVPVIVPPEFNASPKGNAPLARDQA